MNLFIDTNVFLAFYHYSNDDLEELRKLTVLVGQRQVKLILPEQVVVEFDRNRETKISDALKRLREQKLTLQFPQLAKDYPMYIRLRELQREYDKTHAELLDALSQDISQETLKADVITRELFGLATNIPTSTHVLSAARLRYELGNPPGKGGSLGDAINWESILEGTPMNEDLFFVTDDKDYSSPLDERRFNQFLLQEWREKNRSELHFYSKLSALFGQHFPEIKLASEYAKDSLIKDLFASRTFAQAHATIARLRPHAEFTIAQINDIVRAAISNNQIYLILGDPDVYEFLDAAIRGQRERVDPDNLQALKALAAKSGAPLKEL